MLHRQPNRAVLTLVLLLIGTSVLADPPAIKRQRTRQNDAGQNGVGQSGDNRNIDNQNLVIKVAGKLKGFEQGVLVVIREDGKEVLVKLPEEVHRFQFVAQASAKFLQQGMLVRFNGTFNKAGVAQSPIAKVELFQPINGKMSSQVRRQYYPGIYVDQADARKQSGNGVAKCGVVGTLMGIDSFGVMSVRAGKVPVQIPLVQNAKFEIRYNNLNLAKPGDEINVSGFYNPPDETKVMAQSVVVTTDRVYGEFVEEEAEVKPKKRRTRRRRRKTKEEPVPEDSDGTPATEAVSGSPSEDAPK